MTEVKKGLIRQSKHFQRLYSGYGIDNSSLSEEFWQSVWEDKPRICLMDIFDTLRVKKQEESTPSVKSSKNEFDIDFTNSKQFSLVKWQKNDFFKLNKCNGAITCTRHAAHMKHLESFDSVRLKKDNKEKITRKVKINPKVRI